MDPLTAPLSWQKGLSCAQPSPGSPTKAPHTLWDSHPFELFQSLASAVSPLSFLHHRILPCSRIIPISTQTCRSFSHLQNKNMDLEGIMLSEVRQTKTNIIWFHLYVKSKRQTKQQARRYREQIGGGQRWGVGLGRKGRRCSKGTDFQLEDE